MQVGFIGDPKRLRSISGPAIGALGRASSKSSSSGGTMGNGYLGPFPERQGCPPGTIVAHRYGKGLDRMVQCKAVSGSRPASVAQPQQQKQVFKPTVEVSPTIQTQVSPQISPVFQQTGRGDQSAGTTMTSPGGQSGRSPSTSQTGSGIADFLQIMQLQDAQRREEARLREEERQREFERQLALREMDAAAQSPVGAPPPVSSPVVSPGAFMPPIIPENNQLPEKKNKNYIPLIAGVIIAGGAAIYFAKSKGKKK